MYCYRTPKYKEFREKLASGVRRQRKWARTWEQARSFLSHLIEKDNEESFLKYYRKVSQEVQKRLKEGRHIPKSLKGILKKSDRVNSTKKRVSFFSTVGGSPVSQVRSYTLPEGKILDYVSSAKLPIGLFG